MTEDIRTDEALVIAYLEGELTALDILFKRYLTHLKYYLLKNSWFRDDDYLDDILQDITVVIIEELNSHQFYPKGAGSFRSWVYNIAENIYRTKGRDRAKQPKPVSEFAGPDSTVTPEDILDLLPVSAPDYQAVSPKLSEIISHLKPLERKLMQLIYSEGKKYKDILQEPEFADYSLDYLMRKVYLIRKKAEQLMNESKKEK
jgi:RNA polymerase sigma factor (sigma-70 family)